MNDSRPGILERIADHAKYLFYEQMPGGIAPNDDDVMVYAEVTNAVSVAASLGGAKYARHRSFESND